MSITSTGPRSTPSLQPGERVGGKYLVSRLLGQGGMGAVYLVTHETLETVFALKVLSRGSEMHQARFVREARILASLRSEHVAKVVDFGVMEEFGAPYMVMEYLPGADLAAHLEASSEPLRVRDAVDHILEACEGLAEAHGAGIVHRDVKPSNLFLSSRFDGSPIVKVLDFGIAKTEVAAHESALTSTQMVFGSPAYMSPEQVRSSKTAGPQTDIWSLALVLYELVSKRHPFQGDTPTSIVAAISADEPAPLPAEIGPNLWSVLEPALRKDPSRRPPTIAAFAASLAPFGGERGRIVLARIERLAASRTDSVQSTHAMLSGSPTAVRDASHPPPAVLADGPTPASARTTYGGTQPKRVSAAVLVLGGVVIVGVGAALGIRSQASHGTAPPTVLAATPQVVPEPVPEPMPEPMPEPVDAGSLLSLAASSTAAVLPAALAPAGKPRKSTGKPGAAIKPSATTAPRQGEFD